MAAAIVATGFAMTTAGCQNSSATAAPAAPATTHVARAVPSASPSPAKPKPAPKPKPTTAAPVTRSAAPVHTYVPPATHPAAPPKPAPTTAAAAPRPASCTPLTNGGNCYEPGEFCRKSDHGAHGVAGDGKAIVCEDNDGWRWEPA